MWVTLGFFSWGKAPAQPQLGSWDPCQARMDLGCFLVLGSFPGSLIPAMAG